MRNKAAFIAIIGLANVGKSSLLNSLVGQKISIISKKPQTTRDKIIGILTKGENQLVFLDLPGYHKRKNKLSDYMMRQIRSVISDVDVCILVVNAKNQYISEEEKRLIEEVKKLDVDVVLVINKIDLLAKKGRIMEIIEMYGKEIEVKSVIPISVKKGEGIEILINELNKFAKPSPHYFSEDMITDRNEREIVSEIIREKILRNINEEIPYGTAVIIEKMKERRDKEGNEIVDIEATIYCERASHKGIIIGKGGRILKRIGMESRMEIEKMLEKRVNLRCWLKVRDNWRNDERMLKNLGYEVK